ncbi:MAG: alpha/beta fold hydrolase [Pseudomonadota bacterium]
MTTLEKIKLPMPRLGETMDEGTIANWVVKPGESFARGDALLELETDKTLVEYPALGAGKLLETLVDPGDIVAVGAPIAVIETSDAWEGIGENADAEQPSGPAPKVEPSANEASSPIPATTESSKYRATPLARRIAKQNNIDLNSILGSGRRGRIEACDVEAALETEAGRAPVVSHSRLVSVKTDTVMLAHGLGGAGSNWTALRGHLERSGYKTKAPDLPGHGRNLLEAPDVESLVSWMVAQLSQQPKPVHLVGHSLGAHVCTFAAETVPEAVATLTLIAPAGCGHDINGTFIEGVANASRPGEVAHLMRMLGPKASSLGDDVLDSMASELSEGRLKELASSMARGNMQLIDTLAALSKVASIMPTQAVFGSGDAIIPKEHIFNIPPQVAAHVVRCGHMPHWDSPGLLQRLLVEQE